MPPATGLRRRTDSRSAALGSHGGRVRWLVLAIVVIALAAVAALAAYPGLMSRLASPEQTSDPDAGDVRPPDDPGWTPPEHPARTTQPGGLIYRSSRAAAAYAHPGALVVAGRDNFQDRPFKDVSAAGGTVLFYLDPIIDNAHGRYHALLHRSSTCGPATALWPGGHRANEHGYLVDFRVGSVLQRKLECVLETMVDENAHMAGWFADDLGSRSWFPHIDWAAFPDKQAYREGAIALTRTFRQVADKYGLVFLVNGTWNADDGGGHPDPGTHGNALADGGVVEHHDGEISFFGPYGCSEQWAAQSPVTDGDAINFAITSSPVGTAEYVSSRCFAYVSEQRDYGGVEPWGDFHSAGLPSKVTRGD